jgi:hypothetical protein
VEKEHFLDLTKNYTSLTAEEARAVDELQAAYPYSQVVRCLASRAARDHQMANATGVLAMSAVYSTDRSVLKDIMTAPAGVRKARVAVKAAPAQVIVAEKKATALIEKPETPPVKSVKTQEVELVQVAEETKAVPVITSTPVSVTSGLSGAELVDEIMSDLTRLQDLKKIFETSYTEFRKKNSGGLKEAEKNHLPDPNKETTAERRSSEARPKPTKVPKAPKPASTDLIPEPSSEALLNQIETSRKRVFPDTEKQKEQLQIIDQFITRQPSITKGVAKKTEAADLAENSVSLTDSMVSETLVEVLLRQGKKDKAIEVLRKLIWKFPQKKAIFAAQIEELRK